MKASFCLWLFLES